MAGYSKRPLWQLVVIYLIIGAMVYGAIYYFVIAKKVSYGPTGSNTQQTPAPVSTNAVTVSNYNFSPSSITVKTGTTVTWTNNDGVTHSITADDGSFDTGLIGAGKSESITFAKAGTFTYHCKVH